MKDKIIKLAKENGADLVGFASAERFEKDDVIFKIFPKTKTVIGLAFRVLRGAFRGVEEGSTFYQYSTMGVENMEETVMPLAQMRVANLIEEQGFTAVPQRRHQLMMTEPDSTNPEMCFDKIYRGSKEMQMDFLSAAIACGLGEKGLHNVLVTDEFGPFVRYCFILTDAVFESDRIISPHLCDNCAECVRACPGNAISKDGKVDPWKCAVYYKGANGKRNPFMPHDAFSDEPERLKIIAGEADVDIEDAKRILEKSSFYPHISHSYEGCVCGRACDVACYVHLEEKGSLKKSFCSPFRKRKPWELDLSFYK